MHAQNLKSIFFLYLHKKSPPLAPQKVCKYVKNGIWNITFCMCENTFMQDLCHMNNPYIFATLKCGGNDSRQECQERTTRRKDLEKE